MVCGCIGFLIIEIDPFFRSCAPDCSNQPHVPVAEEEVYLNSQSGTMRLDWFTHTLIVKCTSTVRFQDINPPPIPLAPPLTHQNDHN